MQKGIKSLLLFLILVLGFSGIYCYSTFFQHKIEDNTKQSSDVPKSQKVESKILNPLTGLELKSGKIDVRPIAIMINNIKTAQPLIGISKSDIMYEALVEGGITRIMAVFQDPKEVEAIGSVRSARPYYIDLANGHDAIYMHIGGSSEADQIMKSGTIDHFNLSSYDGMFWRDSNRKSKLGYEHSALTSGQRLIDGVLRNKTRYTLNKEKVIFQTFSDQSQVLSGKEAKKLTVKFSNYKTTIFDYSEDKKSYLVSQFDNKQFDDKYNCQNDRENVIILKAKVFDINAKGLKGIELTNGSGKYMSNGKVIDINWEKSSKDASFKFSTTNNDLLNLLPGKIYTCIVPINASVVVG